MEDTIENINRAIDVLDKCDELTYEKYIELFQISGLKIDESKLRQIWNNAQNVPLPPETTSREELVRKSLRDILLKATFDMGVQIAVLKSKKKWWQFWI